MFRRRRRVGAASATGRKFIDVLYPKRHDSQVTPLGTYKTSWGRTVAVYCPCGCGELLGWKHD